MSWCCNPCGRSDDENEDTQPLLSDYDDETSRQRELHKKLHTYQMLRALRQGYLPSTEQAIIQLRVLLASDILNPEEDVRNSLSPSGQLVVKLARQWLAQFIELLRDKNTGDSVQDFLYFLPKGRVELDAQDMLNSASHLATLKPRLDASAAYESAKIIGTLLFGNRDFRMFLTDLNIIAREVFADTAASVANVAEQVAERVAPTELESEAVKQPGAEGVLPITTETVAAEAADIGGIVKDGMAQAAVDAGASLSEHLSGVEKETLLVRLQQVVSRLRQRKDYTASVSTIQFLLQRYVEMYSRTIAETVETVSDDVHTNPELDRALEKLWKFIGSFGDRRAWDGLAVAFNKVIVHIRRDPDLEVLMRELGVALNRMLTDPEFFSNTDSQISNIREKFNRVGTESSLRGDLDDLIAQAKVTYDALFADSDIAKLRQTSWRLFNLLSPLNQTINQGLIQDALHVFLPVLISAIQYIPIPRFELSAPDLDLLVESLVLEPGRTVNHSSFFPFRLRVETHNEVSITKARFRTHSQVGTTISVHAEGISLRADELGFWLRLHSGLLRFADEGIASFALDERGIDLTLELDVAADDIDKIISLRSASVKIHHFDYTLRQSKLSWLAWLAKPILRPILRGILEKSIASAVEDALRTANRELVYARERLRATRVADPDDIATFFRAVFARFSPPEADGDTYTALGVSGSAKAGPNDGKPNVFRGVYAPGSIVKVWEDEAVKAPEIVDDEARGRWRNAIFDVPTMAMH